MIPNVTRGGRAAGLMNYLAGAGRHNEHENQRLIAACDRVEFEVPAGTALNKSNAFEVAAIIDQPARSFGTSVTVPEYAKDDDGRFVLDESGKKIRTGDRDAHVWHCSLSLREGERAVSDEEWGRIAHEFVERMGFIDPDGRNSSRWAAVHHGASRNGNDHIHIVVQMVTESGNKAKVHNDFHRAQKVCRGLEAEHGLAQLETEVGRGLAGEKPAERERANKAGRSYVDGPELRRRMRAALATAEDLPGYLTALDKMGVKVSGRAGKGGELAGYSVTLGKGPQESAAVWRAPSKLDSLLSWPSVRARFGDRGREEAEARLLGREWTTKQPRESTVTLTQLPAETVHRMASEPVGPDTLANIYARVSMSLEKNNPGPLAAMSEHMSRAGQPRTAGGVQAGYMMRLNRRFGAKSGAEGWTAVLRQANRLARVMVAGRYAQERPHAAAQAADVLARAEAIVNREAQRLTPASSGARAQGAGYGTPHSRTPGLAPGAGRPRPERDGYGR